LRDRRRGHRDGATWRVVRRTRGGRHRGGYCSRLPVAVISDILGVPDADRPRVLEFGELAAPSLDLGVSWPQYQRVQKGIAGFNSWLADHLQTLREHPGEDLMSQLIQVADEGSLLDETELQATAGLVLAAGFETTVNLLGNGIRLLLNSPDQLAKLAADPSLWPNAVEEICAGVAGAAVGAGGPRRHRVAGTLVRAGETVVIYLAAANRDPAVFDDPHRFDVERANAGKHLAFSGGRHFCLGAALARAEGEVGLRRFFTHFPDVQLAGSAPAGDTRVLRGWPNFRSAWVHPRPCRAERAQLLRPTGLLRGAASSGDRGSVRVGRRRRIDVIGVLDARIKRVCVRAALLEIGARVGGMTEMLVRVALQALGFGCLGLCLGFGGPGAGRGLTGERLPAFDVDRVLPNLFADLVGLGDAAALTLLAGEHGGYGDHRQQGDDSDDDPYDCAGRPWRLLR